MSDLPISPPVGWPIHLFNVGDERRSPSAAVCITAHDKGVIEALKYPAGGGGNMIGGFGRIPHISDPTIETNKARLMQHRKVCWDFIPTQEWTGGDDHIENVIDRPKNEKKADPNDVMPRSDNVKASKLSRGIENARKMAAEGHSADRIFEVTRLNGLSRKQVDDIVEAAKIDEPEQPPSLLEQLDATAQEADAPAPAV